MSYIEVVKLFTPGNPSNAEATFFQSIMTLPFENHLNPVVLVLIEKLSLSTLRWVPYARVSVIFHSFLHNFVLSKLASSSIRVISGLMAI